MSGRAAKLCRKQALNLGIDPASRSFRRAYKYVKKLYNNPSSAEGGYNVY